MYHAQARYADTEALYTPSRAILEKALDQDQYSAGTSVNELAELFLDQPWQRSDGDQQAKGKE
jgi:hypothetical protein